jgi:hypothetical protein
MVGLRREFSHRKLIVSFGCYCPLEPTAPSVSEGSLVSVKQQFRGRVSWFDAVRSSAIRNTSLGPCSTGIPACVFQGWAVAIPFSDTPGYTRSVPILIWRKFGFARNFRPVRQVDDLPLSKSARPSCFQQVGFRFAFFLAINPTLSDTFL